MRIIDKNTDFYDFYQGIYRDDTITFDRTDSFLLTKELMCEYLSSQRGWTRWSNERYSFILLQVCHSLWLFLVDITQWDERKYSGARDVTNYNMELIAKWKNYDKTRCLINLEIIRFKRDVNSALRCEGYLPEYDRRKVFDRSDVLIHAIDTGNYAVERQIGSHKVYRGDNKTEEKHIPLLKACGIANCIEPLEMYLAFEEFFSLERSAQERTESKGLTDKERISNHGFDVKTSFRGKQ